MFGKHRFYCTECRKYKDRRNVTADEWEQIYLCRECGNPVIRTDRVLWKWLEECIEFIVKKGKEEDFQ